MSGGIARRMARRFFSAEMAASVSSGVSSGKTVFSEGDVPTSLGRCSWVSWFKGFMGGFVSVFVFEDFDEVGRAVFLILTL